MPSKKSFHIIWALDPFEKKSETQNAVITAIGRIAVGYGSSDTFIQPVYILSPSEFDLSVSLKDPWSKEYEESTKKVMVQYLENVNLPNLLPPKIINQPQPSLRQSARTLLTYAKRSQAQLLVVGTHARRGP